MTRSVIGFTLPSSKNCKRIRSGWRPVAVYRVGVEFEAEPKSVGKRSGPQRLAVSPLPYDPTLERLARRRASAPPDGLAAVARRLRSRDPIAAASGVAAAVFSPPWNSLGVISASVGHDHV